MQVANNSRFVGGGSSTVSSFEKAERPRPMSRTMSSDSISNPSKVRSYFRWSPEEEDELRRAVEKFGRKDWDLMRQSHDFPLLSARSPTMLKNKWYKMMRGERQDSDVSEGSQTRSAKTPVCSPKKAPRLSSLPAHLRSKGHLVITPSSSGMTVLTEAGTTSKEQHQTVDSPAVQPSLMHPVAQAGKKLNDALSMLREALAIQVDANKAVASAVAARDSGDGDEEIVRTAMYVANLAQTKAKKARVYVAQARKEHALALSTEDSMTVMSDEDDHSLHDLIQFMQEDDACLSLEQGCPDVEDGSLGISQARMTMPGDNMSPGSLEPHDLFCMSQLDSSSKHEDAALAPAASCPDLTAHFQHSGTVEGNSHFNPDTLIPLDEEMEPSSTDTFLGSFWEPCNMLKICQDVMMGPFIRSD